jgi:hypothetical protein
MNDMARIIKDGDPFSPLDRMLIGDMRLQLRFEVRDQIDLRRIATILREFSNRLEIISDPKRYDQRSAMLMARLERKLTQGRLASKTTTR